MIKYEKLETLDIDLTTLELRLSAKEIINEIKILKVFISFISF